MKTQINFRYNAQTKRCDLLADNKIVGDFSAEDVTYLSSMSLCEHWSDRATKLANELFGEEWEYGYSINQGSGYITNN